MVIRPLVSLLLVLFFAVQPVLAQPAVLSNDYWLSYLPSLDNSAPLWVLVNTMSPQTKVRITYSEDGTFDEFTINPNQPKEYRAKTYLLGETVHTPAKPTKPEIVQKRSIHIQSSAPISVQQFTDANNNVSLSLPVPSAFLGRHYIVAAYNDQDSAFVGNSLLPRSSGEFIVIAPEHSTNVTIVPSGRTSGGLIPGDTTRITLSKGETYWVKGLADSSSNDLSGSRIVSDKPVAVIAGAEVMRAFDARVVPNYWDYNDHIAEYMIPVEQWGTEYITSPLTNKKGIAHDTWGDLIRVFAAEETDLYVNGAQQSPGTRWDFVNVTTPMHFSATKPIMVVQYDYMIDYSSSEGNRPRTSNSMMLLQPRHQWVNEASIVIPTGYERTYVYITADTDSLKLITTSVNGGAPSTVHSRKDGGTPVVSVGDYSTIAIVLAERGQAVITGPCQFSVRNHGTRDNDQISVTYGYGAVTASTFGRLTSSPLAIQTDTLCGAFDLLINDTASEGDGIADVQLLMKQTSNVRLGVEPYPLGAKQVRATVEQIDAGQAAKAAVIIRSREGKQHIVNLTFAAHTLSAIKLVEFKNVVYGDSVCADITVTNKGTSLETITGLRFDKSSGVFTIEPTVTFPLLLAPGDSLIATVCYSPTDTGIWHDDTLVVDLECTSIDVTPIRGIGKVPIVFADDRDYGVVTIGEERQNNLKVMNQSFEVSLTITHWDLQSSEFSFDPSEQARLPVVLAPRQHAYFVVTYKPLNVGLDTAVIHWQTNIIPPYRDSNRKNWSVIMGQGQAPSSVSIGEVLTAVRIMDGKLHLQLQDDEQFISATLAEITGRVYDLGSMPASVDDLVPGVYFLKVVTSRRVVTEKLLVR